MRKNIILLVAAISLVANGVLGYRVFKPQNERQLQQEQYAYLSKRIFVENQNDILINFIPLRSAMKEYIAKQQEEIGVYFEYLPSGNSIGVNDKVEIRLASLIKIPVVMAIYKQIELGNLKNDRLLTVKETDINKEFGDLWKKGPGAQLTVKEAVRLSLVESDNTATRVLVSALSESAIDEVFDRLDIPKDKINDLPVISPKNYASILRSLYLASYVSREGSNEILDILTVTKFNDKLPAGVSSSVKVAHKIGVFESEGVYSDCGIVYAPSRPYLLCIMVKASEEAARAHMVILSKMVYGYIAAVKGE